MYIKLQNSHTQLLYEQDLPNVYHWSIKLRNDGAAHMFMNMMVM